MLHGPDLGVGHESAPDQTGPTLLNHDRLRCLIQSHGDSRDPIQLLVKASQKP